MAENNAAIQRALGRIEGTQEAILQRLDQIDRALTDHREDDQRHFSSIHGHIDTQEEKMAALAVVNERLEQQDKNARMIGKYILGAFGSLITLLGSAAIAMFTGHVKIQ